MCYLSVRTGVTYLSGLYNADVDSRNDGGVYGLPDAQDDEIEDANDATHTGLLLPVNDNNSDVDPADADGQGPGVDDRLDGYNHNGLLGDADDTNLTAFGIFRENDLRPLTLQVYHPLVFSPANAHYLADSLITISTQGGQAPPGQTGGGKIRLWRCKGIDDLRPNDRLGCDPASDDTCVGDGVADGRRKDPLPYGDWIPDGTYTGRQLGLGVLDDSGDFTDWIQLYVEGISPSQSLADVRVTVKIDVPGDNHSGWDHGDAIRMTLATYDLDADSDNNNGRALPAQDPPEETIEEDAPGKVLAWNNDDDDGNGIADCLDATEVADESGNDLIPVVLRLVPAKRWRLHIDPTTPQTCGQVRIWTSSTKGQGRQLPIDAWQEVAGGDLFQTLYVEGTSPSKQWGDIKVRLEIDANGNGAWNSPEPSDRICLTVLEVRNQIFPDEPIEISADDHMSYVVGLLSYRDPPTGEFVDAENDSVVRWQVIEGAEDGTCQPQTTSFAGAAASRLTTATLDGRTYRVRGNLVSLVLPTGFCPGSDLPAGCTIGCGIAARTPQMTVVPGKPAEIWLDKSKESYHADQTDTVDLTATIFDAFGNFVEDGSSISWMLDVSTSDFLARQTATSNGMAGATLLAPMVPRDQSLRLAAGAFTPEGPVATVGVSPVSGTLTSSHASLDIGTAQVAALTAAVDAADGTPVVWTTSTGSITGDAHVAGGIAGATLSSADGRLGPVVVTATIGHRFLVWQGQFTSSAGLALGAEHPVLVADAPADGVESVTWPDGTVRQIPYWTSTPVHIKGPANSLATISLPGTTWVEAYTFDEMTANVIAGQIAGHDLAVTGAVLDSGVKHAGPASLRFDGNDSGEIADAPALDLTNSLHLQAWVRPTSLTAATLVAKGSAWRLEVLADGRLTAGITTTTGAFTATTEQPLQAEVWSYVGLQVEPGILRVILNSHAVTNAAVTGTLSTNDSAVAVGTGYIGHLDDLAIASQIGGFGLIRLSGLDALGRVQLDAQGTGTFHVATCGALPAGVVHAAIPLHASVNPQDVEVIVVTSKSWYVYIYDPILSFLGGDPQTWLGTGANIAGGIVIIGDIGSEVKNLWRMAGFSDTPPNYLEMALSGAGLATELAVGLGEVPDVGISTARAIVARIGHCPLAEIIVKRLTARIGLNQAVSAAEEAFLAALRASDELLMVFKQLIQTEDLMTACVRAHAQLGDGFLNGIRHIAGNADWGASIARQTGKVLGELSDEALAALKQSPDMEKVVQDLGTVLKYVPNPEHLKKILNNPALLGHAYKPGDLLSDMARSGLDFTNADGIIGRLAANNPPVVKGTCFEVRSAAHLKQTNGVTFVATGQTMGRTSSDLLDDAGNIYQCKVSREAAYPIDKSKAWCNTARQRAGSYDKVKWVVPSPDDVPPSLLDWIEDIYRWTGQRIEIIEVPFAW